MTRLTVCWHQSTQSAHRQSGSIVCPWMGWGGGCWWFINFRFERRCLGCTACSAWQGIVAGDASGMPQYEVFNASHISSLAAYVLERCRPATIAPPAPRSPPLSCCVFHAAAFHSLALSLSRSPSLSPPFLLPLFSCDHSALALRLLPEFSRKCLFMTAEATSLGPWTVAVRPIIAAA